MSLLLAAILEVGLLPAGVLAAELPFTDVYAGVWYYNDVVIAHESGLINGKGNNLFCPDDI